MRGWGILCCHLAGSKYHEVKTRAQGQGAMVGSIEDYLLKTPLDVNFKYSRFDVVSAEPRDVGALTGAKTRIALPIPLGVSGAAGEDEL